MLGLAHVHSGGSRRVRRIHAPLKRIGRRPHYCSSLRIRRLGAHTRAGSVPRRERASADAITGDRAGSCVPVRSQGATGALSIQRRVCVVPFWRACPHILLLFPAPLFNGCCAQGILGAYFVWLLYDGDGGA
jgi:hypothetical protein